MNLATADKYAAQIASWLTPYCERLEIVGSIRRRRPICNDVDLVCIPRTSSHEDKLTDMFNPKSIIRNHLRAFLDDYIACDNNGATWLGRQSPAAAFLPTGHDCSTSAHAPRSDAPRSDAGPSPKPDAINLLIQLRKCQLDIFCATEATWATLKLCRTGSKEHNIWLAQRAKDRGGHWNPYKGLTLPRSDAPDAPRSDAPRFDDESDLYAALDLPFIDPINREPNYLWSLK